MKVKVIKQFIDKEEADRNKQLKRKNDILIYNNERAKNLIGLGLVIPYIEIPEDNKPEIKKASPKRK